MSKKAGATGGKSNGASNVGSEEIMADLGFDRWLNRQLHRIYDPVLGEPVPDEMTRLLDKFGPKPQTAVDEDEEGAAE